jgi:hypothetical protein
MTRKPQKKEPVPTGKAIRGVALATGIYLRNHVIVYAADVQGRRDAELVAAAAEWARKVAAIRKLKPVKLEPAKPAEAPKLPTPAKRYPLLRGGKEPR